jgi:hypothetical protein
MAIPYFSSVSPAPVRGRGKLTIVPYALRSLALAWLKSAKVNLLFVDNAKAVPIF